MGCFLCVEGGFGWILLAFVKVCWCFSDVLLVVLLLSCWFGGVLRFSCGQYLCFDKLGSCALGGSCWVGRRSIGGLRSIIRRLGSIGGSGYVGSLFCFFLSSG